MVTLLCVVLSLTLVNSVGMAILAFGAFQKIRVKNVVKPSTELAEFLSDIKTHGYSVTRIDPGTVFHRGVR